MEAQKKSGGNSERRYGLEMILQRALSLFGAEIVSIMLPDEDNNLRIAAAYGINPVIIKNTCNDGSCTRGFGSNSACVYRTGTGRIVETEKDVVGAPYKSNSMCLPIYLDENVIGVLSISNRKEGNFTGSDMADASEFVRGAAGIIGRYYKKPKARAFDFGARRIPAAISVQPVSYSTTGGG